MKWIFLAGLLVFTPLLTMFLRNNRQHLPKAAFALGLLPFIETRLNISAQPYGWPGWQGYVKGIDISLTDAVAVAMIVAGASIKTPLRIKLAFLFFVAVFVISTMAADAKIPSLFYGWQILRCLLVYYAVSRAATADREVPLNLLTGLITGLSIQAVVVVQQHFSGTVQAGGWFGHQNLLGMATHFIVYPAFAAFLGGYYVRRTALCVVAAFVVAWAGGSRATIGLMCVGLFATMVLSCWHRTSSRKMAVAGAGALGIALAVPILIAAIDRRSEVAREHSNDERDTMKAAASMIVADYPLGIGANRFVAVANVGGYYPRAGVTWTSAAAPVHNTYYLIAAEMGVLGVVAYATMLAALLSVAVGTLRMLSPGFEAEYAAGLVVVVLAVAVHSYVEWITMLYPIHAFLAMSVGTMVALRSRATAKKRPPKSVQSAMSHPQPTPAAT
ncbi:O-antigen ligase family protein [Sphingomonas sp. SM33]|uniref:O-antigen ligase family protein n=1 Tax=Sphingomonas telluris TaxID=2907998 RepID=A0ABS9VI74_9SPHN|nr:O-antigen ligase family protein [Sphingomonas telluris]MCH8614660.1 O-antigen ligase family protein [Sphingomonas telluris]